LLRREEYVAAEKEQKRERGRGKIGTKKIKTHYKMSQSPVFFGFLSLTIAGEAVSPLIRVGPCSVLLPPFSVSILNKYVHNCT
jgi:hypothetical protein